jgi:glycosyltransferase involved in cell wall biosynthesis
MYRINLFKRLKKENRLNERIRKIKESNLFDMEWYLSEYEDVRLSGIDPIKHFLEYGFSEGRLPSKDFDCDWYLNRYRDVKESGINPFLHYVLYGKFEQRLTKENLKGMVVKKKNEIDDLITKLWGGFSTYALDDICSFSNNKEKPLRERCQALYSLGRWYAASREWRKSYDNLSRIRNIDIKFYRSKRVKLLLVECLLQMGEDEKSLGFIEPTLENKFDTDFVCSLSNASKSNDKLDKINKIYDYYNLSNISLVDDNLEFEFGNFDCSAVENKINGGSLVSILVPVYNAEEYIRFSISSLLRQTWTNIEIIAVDDSSTDGSFEVLQELSKTDKRLKVYRNKTNLGAYRTRNNALSFSKGDFITVHDSDDWSHPQMLEVQMGAMLADPLIKITCSMMARVSHKMQFMLRPQRNNLEYIHRSYPSVLIRRSDLEMLGEWDGVSANADDEFLQRARLAWGNESVKEILKEVPLSFFLVHENSLTQNSKTSLNSLTFGIRHEYTRQANYWKKYKRDNNKNDIKIYRETMKKPFPIPTGLAPNDWVVNNKYDIVIISDLSLLGGTRRCNEGYINTAVSDNKKVGLFHWPRYDLKVAPIAKEYTELSYLELVDILVPEDVISTELLIIHHPPILKYEIDRVPEIKCKSLAVLINQSPMQLWDEEPHYYSCDEVDDLCERLFKKRPIWIPISQVVVNALNKAGGDWNIYDEKWFPPYNSKFPLNMRKPNLGFGSNRKIVAGRHSRDHWTKWPKSNYELRGAYCAENDHIDVKFLGGISTPLKLLGSMPSNWHNYAFDALDVIDFIDELDFFMHFTHEEYIEEFGRNIMEAMARGKVVILPVSYQTVFGDAAVYCCTSEVSKIIEDFWSSKDKYEEQAKRGFEFVRDNCTSEIINKRINRLLSN